MDLNGEHIKRAVSPYHRESLYCVALDLMALVACTGLFALIGFEKSAPSLFWILPLYLLVECFVNYRISIQSIIAIAFRHFTSQVLRIEKMSVESASSGWLWNSVIETLYPKALGIRRYKIRCREENGKSLKLRMVMSQQKASRIASLIVLQPGSGYLITYLGYSRIILDIGRSPSSSGNVMGLDSINHIL